MEARETVSTQGGTLWVVATPIGNRADLGQRARDVLSHVSRIAAEDTRHSRALLAPLGIDTPLVSLHEHNEEQRVAGLLAQLAAGEDVALISDAGTPLVSDPGFRLVRGAREAGHALRAVPGPSAPLAALAVSGMPSDRFCFDGFLPHAAGARERRLAELLARPQTGIVFESAHRILAAARELAAQAPDRSVFLGRELTKQYEEHYYGPAGRLPEWLEADAWRTRGEFVLVLAPAPAVDEDGDALTGEQERLLAGLVAELPVKRAARLLADATGLPRNRLYARALDLQQADREEGDDPA